MIVMAIEEFLQWAPVVVPIIGGLIWLVGLEWRVKGLAEIVNIKVSSLNGKVQKLEDKIDDLIKLLLTRDHHDEHERRAD